MAAESWFHDLWKPSKKNDLEKARIGVLAFEVASLLSKLVHQWNSLTDEKVIKLHEEIDSLMGIKKLVSGDKYYILDLICAELLHNLDNVAKVVTILSKKCNDPLLKCFNHAYDDLINYGVDKYQWKFTWKKMNKKVKKIEKLCQEMEALPELEQTLIMKCIENQDGITWVGNKKKLAWKQQEINRLKEMTLWNKSYDYVVILLARSIFTIFYRIGEVFESLLMFLYSHENRITRYSFGVKEFDVEPYPVGKLPKQKVFEAPPETLGASGLALRYAKVIIVLEKLMANPHLIGQDARNDLYNMLPKNIRISLRARLKPFVRIWASSFYDMALAEEWSEIISTSLEWLSPLAHNMIKWQSERRYEYRKLLPMTGVLLAQTLYYANQERIEEIITELLVGLNYIWRGTVEKLTEDSVNSVS